MIDMAELYNPTLLLVDVQMPVLDGLSAIRQLRAGGMINQSLLSLALLCKAMSSAASMLALRPT